MKKTILTFGLISGGIMATMMVITGLIGKNMGFDKAEILGYSTMVLAGIMIFVGVKSYRDNTNGGFITFGKAFKISMLIVVVSSMIYVATWMILFNTIFKDFMEQYGAAMVEKAKASGLSAEQLAAKKEEMLKFKEMYKNPFFRAAITFMEPLPVGVIMSLIASFVLKKKQPSVV
jgi:hypothetical protein